MSTRLAAMASLLMASLLPATALAQGLDYGALEQLFGEPVTTSATGTPQRATEVPANMEIVTADQIRRSGAYDIPGVLRHVLGVDVLQWGNDNADVGMRGYDQVFSSRVLVLIDGRQVYADQYGYTPWGALPVELIAIRQIEVVRGPNAALFGFNAADGVINIVTYSPLYDNVNAASVSAGTQGMVKGSVVQTIKFSDRGGVRLSASGRRDDDFSTPVPASAGTLHRLGEDRFAFDVDGAFKLGDNMQLGFEVSHAGAGSNDFDAVYSLALERNFSSSVKGWLTADTDLGLLQATVYHNWTSQYAVNALHTPLAFDDEVTVAQFQDAFRLGPDHTFRASVEYRHNSADTTPFHGGTISYDNYAASGMWSWAIIPSLSLTNAVRWENLKLSRSGALPPGYPFTNADWGRTITEFDTNTGLVWKADDIDTFRLIVSRGVQLPSLANFGLFVISSPFINSTGNPDTAPTDVMNYEIDWDRVLTAIDGKIHAAVFKSRTDDFITLRGGNFGGGPPPYTGHTNANASVARGVEIGLEGKIGKEWNWGVNYRYEYIRDHFYPFAQGGIDYLDFEHVTPNHVIKANLGWARDRWEIDGYAYYQSATRGLAGLPFASGSFLSPVNAYVGFDGRIAYRLTDWATLALSGQNLFASPQQQTSGPKVERRLFGTLTVNF